MRPDEASKLILHRECKIAQTNVALRVRVSPQAKRFRINRSARQKEGNDTISGVSGFWFIVESSWCFLEKHAGERSSPTPHRGGRRLIVTWKPTLDGAGQKPGQGQSPSPTARQERGGFEVDIVHNTANRSPGQAFLAGKLFWQEASLMGGADFLSGRRSQHQIWDANESDAGILSFSFGSARFLTFRLPTMQFSGIIRVN